MALMRNGGPLKPRSLDLFLASLILFCSVAVAHDDQTTTPLVGLVGLGIEMYKPLCAATCHNILSRPELECSIPNHTGGHGHRHSPASGHMAAHFLNTPECHASDTYYLMSLAYCFSHHCRSADENLPVWELEQFWSEQAARGLQPKWTYGEALQKAWDTLGDTSPRVWNHGVMNYTAAANQTRYAIVYGSFYTAEHAEVMHARYALITLLIGLGLPVLLSLAQHLPYYPVVWSFMAPYLEASIYKGYNARILPYWLGYATTVGQALNILAFFVVNIALSSIDYQTHWPHRMYRSEWVELLFHIANRTGVIAFAIAPLVLLLASRNNILLWLSNWSHGTFILLHRWFGRVFLLQSVIHSIIELHIFIRLGRYPAEEKKPYWIWGVVATVCTVGLIVFGSTWFRRRHYEVFLITHIILVVFVLAGSWYHVNMLYFGERGYENWLYACFAVWAADRILRVLWMAKTGIKSAKITRLSENIVRVDINGVEWGYRPGMHGYAYWPSLSWRVWENHPFSVIPTSLIRREEGQRKYAGDVSQSPDDQSLTESRDGSQAEKSLKHVVRVADITTDCANAATTGTGMTLYVKQFGGMTKHLQAADCLKTLVEGPYTDKSHDDIMLSDRLICLAGGVGITGVLPFTTHHPNAKLYWSMKEADASLAKDLEETTKSLDESEVSVGQRFNARSVMESESAMGYKTIGVLVCGPEALCDEVRSVVTSLGRHRKTRYKLAVEAFSW